MSAQVQRRAIAYGFAQRTFDGGAPARKDAPQEHTGDGADVPGYPPLVLVVVVVVADDDLDAAVRRTALVVFLIGMEC